MKNPLLVDPTRTTTLRQRFISEMKRRFNQLAKAIRQYWADQIGVPRMGRLAGNFVFETDPQKLEAFNRWFKQQVERALLFPSPDAPFDTPWVATYIDTAYKRGMRNAFLSTDRAGILTPYDSSEEFIQHVAFAPEAMSKVKLLATRTFENLKGISEGTATRMNQILAEAMIVGLPPLEVAEKMVSELEDISFRRAFTLARTEIIFAHAEGQLDAFERLGVEELGIQAEWSTAGDERVCPQCRPQEGKIFTIEQARGKIPLHPNCRCTWIPHLKETRRRRNP